ncbi:MAG: beta-ketoacyl-ACP synthase III [Desulfovibrionaceae bacterium]
MKTSCHILGMGTYVPSRILTNADIATFVETTNEWITSRTGISQRHVLAEGENTSDAGLAAAQAALAESGLQASDLTHVFVATCTPDALCPSVACIVAGKLGCGPVMALDFNAACSGFLYGLSLVQGIISAQPHAKILLLCAEGLTRRVNWQDRATCVLFGDGAGAVVISGDKTHSKGLLEDVACASDGTLQHLITIGGGTAKSYKPGDPVTEDFFVQMQGREVFKHAVRNMTAVCLDLLKKNTLSIADVDLLVPHQANMRIIEAVGSRLEIAPDHVFTNVQNYGNTSSASVPIALVDARAQGRIGTGSLVLMTSFGSGLTWGAALIRF